MNNISAIDANTWMIIVVVMTNLIGVTIVVAKNSFGIKQLTEVLKDFTNRLGRIEDTQKEHYGMICELKGKMERD